MRYIGTYIYISLLLIEDRRWVTYTPMKWKLTVLTNLTSLSRTVYTYIILYTCVCVGRMWRIYQWKWSYRLGINRNSAWLIAYGFGLKYYAWNVRRAKRVIIIAVVLCIITHARVDQTKLSAYYTVRYCGHDEFCKCMRISRSVWFLMY